MSEKDDKPQPSLQQLMEFMQEIGGQLVEMQSQMTVQAEKLSELSLRTEALEPRVSLMFGENEMDKEEERKSSRIPDDDKSSVEEQSNSGSGIFNNKPDRRKTLFQQTLDKTTAMAGRHSVVYQMPTPSFSHIFLSSTALSEYSAFVNKWLDWETQNGIKLEPAKIVKRELRLMLMFNNDMEESDFNSLTPSEFCHLMAKETKVYSKVEFAKTFKHALKDIPRLLWENIRPNTHERFFQGILKRVKIYTRTFQILMEENKNFCPDIEGKEYGLAQIFLDLIDKEYNKNVLAEIPKIKATNYSKIKDFLDSYLVKGKEHFEMSRTVRLIPYGGEDFKQVTQERIGQRFPKRDYSSNSSNSNTPSYPPTRLNFVDVSCQEDTQSDDDPEDTDPNVEDIQQNVDNNATEMEIASAEENIDQLLQASTTPAPSVRGCMNYSLYGNCFSGDKCKNVQGHNRRIAETTRAWMRQKLEEPWKETTPTRNDNPPRDMKPPQRIMKPDRNVE